MNNKISQILFLSANESIKLFENSKVVILKKSYLKLLLFKVTNIKIYATIIKVINFKKKLEKGDFLKNEI